MPNYNLHFLTDVDTSCNILIELYQPCIIYFDELSSWLAQEWDQLWSLVSLALVCLLKI